MSEGDNVIDLAAAAAGHAVSDPTTLVRPHAEEDRADPIGRGIAPRSRRSSTRSGWTSTRRARARRPDRFLRALFEATAGYDGEPKLATSFPAETTQAPDAGVGQIIEGPIEFHCLCEHHALPFFGTAYIGYIADERILGISKLTRLVRLFARRFTVQERLGEEIADGLASLIDPRGIAVHLEASHLCTQMRGVEEQSRTVTTFWRGAYDDPELRREFLLEARSNRRG